MKGVEKGGIITKFNNGATVGPNPFLTAGDKALSRAIVLMNELGLTPRGRLATNNHEGGKYAKLLNGPGPTKTVFFMPCRWLRARS